MPVDDALFFAAIEMNGMSVKDLFSLFCCPPCPGRIAAKLAFMPPEATYELRVSLELCFVESLVYYRRYSMVCINFCSLNCLYTRNSV